MTRVLPFILLFGCSHHRMINGPMSESPCVDGTVVNMEQSKCEGLYVGTVSDGKILKIRCTYSETNNFWTRMWFYAVPHGDEQLHSNWGLYCEDRYVKMYAVPSGIKIKIEDERD